MPCAGAPRARDPNTGFVRTTTTDATGAYTLSYVPAGTYELTIELSGFKTLKRAPLRFEVGQEITVDASLDVANVAETVTVRETPPLVEPKKSAVDMVVSREQIDSLPLAGRQAASLALLSPGVVPRGGTEEPVTTGGQPRGSGELLVDGVSNELMAVNSIRSDAPPDAIQEFQVITSQGQAEFGNASGVILNTITREGTNDLHGRLYYFHRDQSLDAKNPFQTSKAKFEQKQPGGWLGGPIVKDRTHYFLTYEATRRMQIATVTSPVEPGDVEQPSENNQFLGKVTHQLNAAHRLTGRFSVDRPTRHNVGVGGFSLKEVGIEQLGQDLMYVGNLASILSNRSVNELRVQLSRQRSQPDPKQPDVFTIIRPSSTSGKSSNVPQSFAEQRVQVVDNYTHELVNHRLKVGIDMNRVTLSGVVFQNIPGVFQFSTDRPFNAADPTTYPTTFIGNAGDTTFRMVTTGVSAFAQDAWRLPRNVTLNLGLRYDGWDVTGIDLQKGNIAPRLALAWDPLGTHKTAIRGGYGIFYNNVITNEALFTAFLAGQRSVVISNPGYPDPFARGSSVPQTLSTYIAQPDQPLPHAYQATLGFQREVTPGLSVGADYVNSRGRNLIRIVDTNPVTPPTFTRPDPTRGFVRRLQGTGYSDYHGLLISGKSRFDRAVLQVSYTLASYKTTTEAENALPQQDDFNVDDSYGYGNFDQRHRAVISGYATLPLDIQIGGVLAARSAVPFNITTGRDNNRNANSTDRPDLIPGARIGTADMTNRASFVDPGTRPGNLPRNAGRGSSFWQLDLRFAKRIRLGRASAEGLIEAFNVTNHVNFNNPAEISHRRRSGVPTRPAMRARCNSASGSSSDASVVRRGLRPCWCVALALLLCGLASMEAFAQGTRLLRRPTVSRDHVAFEYAGDLWVVSRSGGQARRLTSTPEAETDPHFSPDGTQIAFTSTVRGNTDVYLVPTSGGEPTRLTYHPGVDVVRGWTPDGRRILFASSRATLPTPGANSYLRLWTIAREGGLPEALPIPRAFAGMYSPDGRRVAYEEIAVAMFAATWAQNQSSQWRHYRGGRTHPVRLLNLADLSVEKLPWTNSNDTSPMWVGNALYFLSDRNGATNLFAYRLDSKQLRQLTQHDDFDIMSASAGPDALVYEQAGYLHLVETATGKSTRLTIEVTGDLPWARPHFRKIAGLIRNAALSPTGVRAAFEASGEIVTVPAEKGDYRNL